MTLEELKKQRKQLDKQIEDMENKLRFNVGNVYVDKENNSVYVRLYRRKQRVLTVAVNQEDSKTCYACMDKLEVQIENLIKNLQEALKIMQSNEA